MKFEAPVVSELTSKDLENYVSAIFQFGGYYINQDLSFTETQDADQDRNVDLFQLDIIALNFHPFGEDMLTVEVKGGGTFTDLFKYLGITKFLNPTLSYLIMNNSGSFDDICRLGERVGIVVANPSSIIETVKTDENQDLINFWYWSNSLSNKLVERQGLSAAIGNDFNEVQSEAYQQIRRYLASLKNRIWKTLDPVEQSIELESLMNENRDFVRQILRIQKEDLTDTENAIVRNILCESASYVVLISKLYYVASAVRCAIHSIITSKSDYLEQIENEQFRNVVERLCENISMACKLPSFLQFWIFLCGGMFDKQNKEIEIFSRLMGIREDNFLNYLELTKDIFTLLIPSGTIQWSLNQRDTILEFNNMPNSIRGLSLEFRKHFEINIENYELHEKMFTDRLNAL